MARVDSSVSPEVAGRQDSFVNNKCIFLPQPSHVQRDGIDGNGTMLWELQELEVWGPERQLLDGPGEALLTKLQLALNVMSQCAR